MQMHSNYRSYLGLLVVGDILDEFQAKKNTLAAFSSHHFQVY